MSHRSRNVDSVGWKPFLNLRAQTSRRSDSEAFELKTAALAPKQTPQANVSFGVIEVPAMHRMESSDRLVVARFTWPRHGMADARSGLTKIKHRIDSLLLDRSFC
jgi:hypothetical protein